MRTIAILNGPNLGRLGKREPEIYGALTLEDLERQIHSEAERLGVSIDFRQSNHEGQLIDWIEEWATSEGVIGLIINPGGLTHTSVALRDALAGSGLLGIEVHLSHIHRREEFRHKSITAPACVGVISGLGFEGYLAAFRYLVSELGIENESVSEG